MAKQVVDYYKVLGVARNATPDQLKKAYRDKVRRLHPDVAADKRKADKEIRLVLRAWEVLSDPDRRHRYNELLAAADRERAAREEALRRRRERKEGRELFRKARVLKSGGALAPAKELARKATELLPADPEPWELLGDIAFEQRDFETTLYAYGQALQLSKSPALLQRKLEFARKAAARAASLRQARFEVGEQATKGPSRTWRQQVEDWTGQRLARRLQFGRVLVALFASAWLLASFILLKFALVGAESLPKTFYYVGALDAFAVGLALEAAGALRYFDDELVHGTTGATGGTPKGLLLFLLNLLNYFAGLSLYLLIALVEGEFSLSLVLCYAAGMTLVLALATLVPAKLLFFALWLSGPAVNLVFLGWGIASMLRPAYWSE